MSNIVEFKNSFEKEVLQENKLVLIDFWAPWCRYCILLTPTLHSIAQKEEFKNNLKIVTINVDEQPSIAQQFDVMSIPHLILFKNGKQIDIEVDQREEEDLEELIREYI